MTTDYQRLAAPERSDSDYQRLETDLPKSPAVQISWAGLVVTAKMKHGNKELLRNVTGGVKQGEFMALMGPSGAGKTTFLNTISQRDLGANCSVTDGRISYNQNTPDQIDIKGISGFVPQEDVLMDVFTVREVLMFSANLRVPHLSKEQKTTQVEKIVEALGLTGCADTRIGNTFTRGLSGGERKRCSIGFELIANPSVLFLDEPTTGLDSFTSNHVIEILRMEAERSQKTIVATIHQPSSQTFALFDRLLLLCDGKVVYQGKATEAVPYFASIGLKCPDLYNPADFFMTMLSGQKTQAESRDEQARRINDSVGTLTSSIAEAAED